MTGWHKAVQPGSRAAQAAAPYLTRPWASPSGVALFWVAAQAVGSLLAVGLITRGYQQAATGTLAVFEYAFLITASFWAWVLWGDGLDAAGFLGIALIVASGAIVAIAQRVPASLRRPQAERGRPG